MAEVRVKALRFPRGPFEQASGGQTGRSVAFYDGVQLESLADAHELHLPGFLLTARAARRVWQHVTERPSVQHCLHSHYNIYWYKQYVIFVKRKFTSKSNVDIKIIKMGNRHEEKKKRMVKYFCPTTSTLNKTI